MNSIPKFELSRKCLGQYILNTDGISMTADTLSMPSGKSLIDRQRILA